jgi:drug/metabolite transporter (DMT)-like permease
VVIYLFGPIHFADLGSPLLWQWMLLYGGIIIVSGQLAWDSGIRKSRSIDVSVVTSFTPVAGVLAAFLILGERPTTAHYIGGAVLIIGIAMCLWGARAKAMKKPDESGGKPILEAESRTGFKGV